MDLKSLKENLMQRFGISKATLSYLIIAVCAVLALLLIRGAEKGADNKSVKEAQQVAYVDVEYEKELSKKLEEIISKIEGAGKVSVMLTIDGSSTIQYAADVDKSELDTKSKTVIIGNKEAVIRKVELPRVTGVLVVCTGGDSPIVKERVINAVSTVLNISSSKVYVTKSN